MLTSAQIVNRSYCLKNVKTKESTIGWSIATNVSIHQDMTLGASQLMR